MRIEAFKAHPQTQQFVAWLSRRIDGTEAVDFQYKPRQGYRTLGDARDAYAWPRGTSTIPTPDGDLVLAPKSNLAANSAVLQVLSNGLRTSLANSNIDQGTLADWVEAVLRWGGVYLRQRGGGNAGWLDARRAAGDLRETLKVAMEAFISGSIHADDGPINLRSNAGLTKVYSLVLDDFIIYDSRVAGALAWMVMSCWKPATGDIPPHLRFVCMPAKEGSNVAAAERKARSPDGLIFSSLQGSGMQTHRKHAMWNLRANHVLTAALEQAQQRCCNIAPAGFRTVRDVEAALFVMGYDLRHALMRDTSLG